MKKNVSKKVKSIVIAMAVCAGLALGALGVASGSDLQTTSVVATHPNFIGGTY